MIDYEKYLVRKPIYESCSGVKNRQSPAMTYMSRAQVPEVDCYLEFGWIYGLPEPNPHISEHVHDFDEIIMHFGGGPYTSRDLGAEIEFYIGGQPITFNTTTSAFIPRGVPHGPLTWKKFARPHVQMVIMLGTGNDGTKYQPEGPRGGPGWTTAEDLRHGLRGIRCPDPHSGSGPGSEEPPDAYHDLHEPAPGTGSQLLS